MLLSPIEFLWKIVEVSICFVSFVWNAANAAKRGAVATLA